MKKIFIIVILSSVLMLGCNEDDYVPPYGDFSSFLWTTTSGFEESDYVLALNNYVGFRDLSRNAISRTWDIPEGTKILTNDFNENDTIYSNLVVGAGPSTLSGNLINILFDEPGMKEVGLSTILRDSVENAFRNGENWQVDQTFTINVFDDIKPAFKVLKGTEEVLNVSAADMPDFANQSSWPTIEIEAGEELTYIDLTTIGEPDERRWTFEGGNIESSIRDTISVLYNGLGNFVAGEVRVFRDSNDKPDGEETKLIPLNIEVIPSTKPFVINGNISESIDEVISFNVTGEIATLFGEEGNFTVNVTNAATGFDQNIPVQTVSVNPDDATRVDLILTAPIYNSDVVTVSYASGSITSVDARTLQDFDSQVVVMDFQGAMNVDGFTGFETPWGGGGNQYKKANTEGYFAQHNANNPNGPLYYWKDDSFARIGDSSMKFETPETGIPNLARLQGSAFTSLSPVTAGSYLPTVWVYLDADNTMSTIEYNFTADTNFVFDISTTPRGEWVLLTLPEVTLGDINSGRFDINIRGAGQGDAIVQKLWIDSFDLLIVELRQ